MQTNDSHETPESTDNQIPSGFHAVKTQFSVEDHREGESPNELGQVEVAVELDFGNFAKHQILMQNDNDGVLRLASNGSDFDGTYWDVLEDSGMRLDEDDNVHERLSDILDRVGITGSAQNAFDEYLAEREPKITEEIYRPDSALGGTSYRAFLDQDGEVSIQSSVEGIDGFRSHGLLSRDEWDKFEAALGDDSGNPSYIARLCDVLDNSRGTQRELEAALSPRDSHDIER